MKNFAAHHYGKLWVLGMGLLFSPDIFEYVHGVVPQQNAAVGTTIMASLFVLALSLIGSFHSSDANPNE